MKNIVVVGGGGGIGYEITMKFAEAGHRVVATGIDKDKINKVYKELIAMGVETFECVIDATDLTQIDELKKSIEKNWGSVDVLVNCQGMHHKIKTEDESSDYFSKMMDVNVTSIFNICKSLFPLLKISGDSCIINMASMGSFIGLKDAAAYTASKGAVGQLTKAFAVDWADYGIRSNAIAPGWIITPLSEKVLADPKYSEPILNRIPMKRFGTPKDIAEVAFFIASTGGSYINGAVIPVDGGALASI